MSLLLFLAAAVILAVAARSGHRPLGLLGFSGLMQADPWRWMLPEDPTADIGWALWTLATGAPLAATWLVLWAAIELLRAARPREAALQRPASHPASPWTHTGLRLVATALLTGIAATCLLLTGDLMYTHPHVLSHAGSVFLLMAIWSVMPVVVRTTTT